MNVATLNAAKEAGASKVKFYYERTPVIDNAFTACLLLDEKNNVLARGVSICSLLDKHNKKEARNKACGRAIKALQNKSNSLEINPIREIWDHTCVEMTYKGDMEYFKDNVEKYSVQVNSVDEVEDGKFEVKYLVPYSHPVLHANMFFNWKSEYQPEPTEEEIGIFPKLLGG